MKKRSENGSAPVVLCPLNCGRDFSKSNLSKHKAICVDRQQRTKKIRQEFARDSYSHTPQLVSWENFPHPVNYIPSRSPSMSDGHLRWLRCSSHLPAHHLGHAHATQSAGILSYHDFKCKVLPITASTRIMVLPVEVPMSFSNLPSPSFISARCHRRVSQSTTCHSFHSGHLAKRLSQTQKKQIRERALHAPILSREALGVWAMKEFNLSKPVPRTKINGIVKPIEKTRNIRTGMNLDAYQVLRDLEPSIAEWVDDPSTGLYPNQEMIKIHAEEVLKKLKELGISEDEVVMPCYSNGWLHRFCLRNGVRLRMMSGEAASVREEEVVNGRARIKVITKDYSPKDTFNVDETAYIYRDPGKRAMSKRGRRGQRGTRLASQSWVGPMPMDPRSSLFSSSTARPLHSVQTPGAGSIYPWDLRHTHGGQASMHLAPSTAKPPDVSIVAAISFVARSAYASYSATIDNVSSHNAGGIEFTNIRVEKLPKNTTSVLHLWIRASSEAGKPRLIAFVPVMLTRGGALATLVHPSSTHGLQSRLPCKLGMKWR